MPDKVIDIPSVGQIAFPDSMSDAQINAAATRLYQQANPGQKQPPVKSWMDTAIDWLPSVAGAVGGIAGAAAGPAGAVAGAGLLGAAGEGVKVAANRLRQAAATGDVTTPIDLPDTAKKMATQGAVQGGAETVGQGIGAGMAKMAPWLMQSALKPGVALLNEYKTTAPKLVQTLLDEGVSVTENGVAKLQKLFDATNQEIRSAVANATGQIDKKTVAARVLPTAQKLAQQVNPTRDLQAAGETVGEFLNHPVMTGPTLSVPEAQAMKVGTYQQIGKKYGEVSSASIETQKALARGLKEEIAAEVPGIGALNQRDSELMAALDATGRRVALSGNKDPVGFAWVAAHPTTFLAALFDRSPAIKSMVSRGMYQSAGTAAKVAPQLIRAAVVALTTGESGASPAQGSSDSAGGPTGQ